VSEFELVILDEAPPAVGAKLCPYCLCWHDRPGNAVYCCRGHAIASAAQQARAAGRLRTVFRRQTLSAQGRTERRQRWRDVAMGRDVDENLGRIFPPGSKRKVE
jgi:hypothetical protein